MAATPAPPPADVDRQLADVQAEIKTLETELAELRARPMIDGGKP